MHHRNSNDVKDGFGNRTGSCRVHTLSRDVPESEVKLWVKGHTRIGPVLRVKTTCYLNVKGTGIQIPSTSANGSTFGLSHSRGPSRHVDELRHNDPDYSPENFFELGNYWSTQETHARQPTAHSRFQYDPSEDFIPIAERNRIGITRKTYILETSKLVRHADLQERESDGAIHWKSMGPKLRHAFRKERGDTFSETDWINHCWKESNKTRFQYCKNVIAPEIDGSCRSPIQMERIPISPRTFISYKVHPRRGNHRWW